MRRLSLLALPLFLIVSMARAETPTGQWGSRGISKHFAVEGNLLYAADGRGITVYDVSDPAAIHRIEVEIAGDETFDLALTPNEVLTATHRGIDRYARSADGSLTPIGSWQEAGATSLIAATTTWVGAARDNQLFLLERAATGLLLRNQVPFAHNVRALKFVGRYLYVAVEDEGIYVLDPPSGTAVTTIARTAHGLALSGDTLWGASPTGGLTAIDVTDPASPRVLSATGVGTLALDGVAAAGTRVYAFAAPDQIYFFNATDVQAPQLVATQTEWVDVMMASGSRLFFSGPRLDRDKFTYETGKPVRVFDAAKIGEPALAGEVQDYAGPVSGVWTDGSLAYVIDPPFFRVIDVSKTSEPREIGSLELPFDKPQTRVRVKNGIAIVYGHDYVHLIDVSDPIRPRFMTTFNPRGHSPDDAAILSDGTFVELNDHSGIHVVDYVNYDPPVQIGGRISHFHSVAAGDDAIYALARGWLLAMSVTNRSKAQDQTILDMPGVQVETAPPNSDRPAHLVVTQGTGVRVFDLANRFVPKQTAFLSAVPGQIATTADAALVDLDGTLNHLDVFNPSALVPTDMHTIAAMQISIAGPKVVVADRYSLRVFGPDTAPPPTLTSPRRRAVGH